MSGHNLYLYLYCVLDHAHPVFILCLDQADRTQDMIDLYVWSGVFLFALDTAQVALLLCFVKIYKHEVIDIQ